MSHFKVYSTLRGYSGATFLYRMVSVGIILELVERRRNKLFDGDVLSKGLFLSAYRGAYQFLISARRT